MRTYYRGNDVVVTDVLFIRRTTPMQSFVIRDLHDVGMVRGGCGPLAPGLAYATGGALIMVAIGWLLLNEPVTHVVALLGLAMSAVAAGAYWGARSHAWELRATYRHADVLLYSSSDSRVFNQISRALQRSMEDAGPPSAWYDLAAAG
ncbi:MAG TPA: DUF6232 family protein [Actinoplanes sp.]|jgi:hypothetical protein